MKDEALSPYMAALIADAVRIEVARAVARTGPHIAAAILQRVREDRLRRC